jgi:hypothetical protein
LHPAIPQGLLDAALNRTFKAFTVLFLMLLEVTSNLRVSWQQLLACCALPDRMILLELLPIASVMMAAGRIIATSRHSTTGTTNLDIKSNLRLHPISLYFNAVTSIGTTFGKPRNNIKQNLLYFHVYINITIPHCYNFHHKHKSLQLSCQWHPPHGYHQHLQHGLGQPLQHADSTSGPQTSGIRELLKDLQSNDTTCPIYLNFHNPLACIQSNPVQSSCIPLHHPVELHTKSPIQL